ncbi:NAD-dependent epimerase/dehydratase family protein [Intrasporangium flavum]|uniref:NAD-dependent epimerase/dehydratase family protein n=1 Tax=Intrasporangium flavum TaxID=1428657 RepID=UPI00096CFCCD|nr:NAD(P)-dependent oxidoreductase [Intrasporangium flavum]
MARLALTGAAGRIAASLRPRLRAAGHDLVLLDAVPVPEPVAGEQVVEADLRDVDAHADAFAGAELVVHLGGLSDERPWPDLLAVNVDGTRAVLDAVVRAGVRRVLLASSVHAAGYARVDDPATAAGMPLPAPDTYYGASKAAVEALGGLYAGRFGLTVVSARIMTFADEPGSPRSLQLWLSGDDMARLVEAVRTTDAGGHHVVWGVSANTRRRVDLEPGRAVGFEPQDDAETFAAEVQRADASQAPAVLGGGFADPSYRLGEAHGGREHRS